MSNRTFLKALMAYVAGGHLLTGLFCILGRRGIERVGAPLYGAHFDPEAGVVYPENAAPLRPGVADVTYRRLADPHVAFFVSANPGHARGDELVCLTELATENLTPAGRRMLGPW